jgi:hypothetical protein
MIKGYAFCIDEEAWHIEETASTEHDTIQLAIEYASEDGEPLGVGQGIMIGLASDLSPSSLISSADIIDTMNERAYDECGEWAEDYPNLSKEEKSELDNLLWSFFEKHDPRNFWTVEKPIKHTITQAELDEYEAPSHE